MDAKPTNPLEELLQDCCEPCRDIMKLDKDGMEKIHDYISWMDYSDFKSCCAFSTRFLHRLKQHTPFPSFVWEQDTSVSLLYLSIRPLTFHIHAHPAVILTPNQTIKVVNANTLYSNFK